MKEAAASPPGESGRQWLDVAIACLVPFVQLALLVGTGALKPWQESDVWTILLVLLQGVPLALRRGYPWPVFGTVLAANSVYYALGLPPTGYDFGLGIALYTLAAWRSMRASLLAYGLVAIELVTMYAAKVGPYWQTVPQSLIAYLLFFFSAVWAWGRYQHVRRERVRHMIEEVEREQRAEVQRTAQTERARIARELHDVLAHHLSLMVIQAGAARRLIQVDPTRAREALGVIEEYGRRGLHTIPSLVRALRDETIATELAPPPTLADVPVLVAQLAESGMPVTLEVAGEPTTLPDGVELSAFRIVQEALTNTLRHAGPQAAALVRLRHTRQGLEVEVIDDGTGAHHGTASASSGRHGLAGMRERAVLYGGTLDISTPADGGFRIRAHFPSVPSAR